MFHEHYLRLMTISQGELRNRDTGLIVVQGRQPVSGEQDSKQCKKNRLRGKAGEEWVVDVHSNLSN
jgi:hypothetical protein